MRLTLTLMVCVSLLLTGCSTKMDDVSAFRIPSPTPFQPGQEHASDSLYADAAPTPLSLPTVSQPSAVSASSPTLDVQQPTEIVPPTATVPVVINPLTGLPASDPNLLDRHPMAIKVTNFPRYTRPQSGLSLADQVFEYYIEGGLTRFIAVFYGNDSEWVGPVRSGRFFDEHVARMYQAFLVFKFADKRVFDYFKTTDIADYLVVPSIGSCPPFQLMELRNIEDYNNNYFNTTAWGECVEKNKLPSNKPNLRPGYFSDEIPQIAYLDGFKVFTYYSEYSYNYWDYVPELGKYIRYQESNDTHDGKEESYAMMMDNANGLPVQASNVVVIFAYHEFENPFQEDDEVYQIDLTGTGEAYVFRDGLGITAKWIRMTHDQPLALTTEYGAPINLRPGVTFYEVIGTNSFASQGDGEWFFHHETP
ncbi:MAG TPA: DUF3048 domain-containing protein [Anaerolineales bacterium]|nr:DUF3048 domain-containing protein [Anaerolineales bacterium]